MRLRNIKQHEPDDRFQSTHSAGNATARCGRTAIFLDNFNPRIPQGMRPLFEQHTCLDSPFQSTHSAGNATSLSPHIVTGKPISIHAFRRECDVSVLGEIDTGLIFQSTHSAGNATSSSMNQTTGSVFQSTHSAGNATKAAKTGSFLWHHFNPRIPQGMRRFTLNLQIKGE